MTGLDRFRVQNHIQHPDSASSIMATQPKLFTPVQFGPNTLQHRVVLAPMTRFRSDDNHVPITKLVAEHYAARAAVPGTLLITDAVYITARAGGFANVPGIWNQEQIDAWKQVSR